MRILALDHGTKNIGVAISDELKMIAQPFATIDAVPMDACVKKLIEIIEEKKVELIIIGMPKNMNGSCGSAAERVNQFIDTLQKHIKVPIKTMDERLSTVQANKYLHETGQKMKKYKQNLDKTAAAIILQSYLDSLS